MITARIRQILRSELAAQFGVAALGATLVGGYVLPHGPLLERYKRFAQAYKDGMPVRLSPELERRIDSVLDEAQVGAEERTLMRFFTSFGADLFHAGSTWLRWGAVIGLPQTFFFKKPEDATVSGFTVGGKAVDWDTREGRLLADGLCLSPAAQKFAIAREVLSAQTAHVWVKGGLAAGVFFITYSLGRAINRRMGFVHRPPLLRYTLYGMVSLFGVGIWVTASDMVRHYTDSTVDAEAAKIGPEYAWGGVEFYEKCLERNRALRALLGEGGADLYTAYGNDRVTLRSPTMPLTERLERLRAYAEKHHPLPVDPPATNGG